MKGVNDLKVELSARKEQELQDRLKFTIDGWSNEELELFEEEYKESIALLLDLFPNKNRAELLRARKDRINRELILHTENYTEEEKKIILETCDLPYAEVMKKLPNRSIWSLIYIRRQLGLTSKRTYNPYKPLTPEEYSILADLKTKNVHYLKICGILGISYSQLHNILYAITDNPEILAFREKYPDLVQRKTTHKKWTKEENELIIKLSKENYTLEDLAQIFGVTVQQMRMKQVNLGLNLKECNTKTKESRKNKKTVTKPAKTIEVQDSITELQQMLDTIGAKSIQEVNDAKAFLETFMYKGPSNNSLSDMTIFKLFQSCFKLVPQEVLNDRGASVILEFGKFKGYSLPTVHKKANSYFRWLLKNSIKLIVSMILLKDATDKQKNQKSELSA